MFARALGTCKAVWKFESFEVSSLLYFSARKDLESNLAISNSFSSRNIYRRG